MLGKFCYAGPKQKVISNVGHIAYEKSSSSKFHQIPSAVFVWPLVIRSSQSYTCGKTQKNHKRQQPQSVELGRSQFGHTGVDRSMFFRHARIPIEVCKRFRSITASLHQLVMNKTVMSTQRPPTSLPLSLSSRWQFACQLVVRATDFMSRYVFTSSEFPLHS